MEKDRKEELRRVFNDIELETILNYLYIFSFFPFYSNPAVDFVGVLFVYCIPLLSPFYSPLPHRCTGSINKQRLQT